LNASIDQLDAHNTKSQIALGVSGRSTNVRKLAHPHVEGFALPVLSS
jgi:hypothetical protein